MQLMARHQDQGTECHHAKSSYVTVWLEASASGFAHNKASISPCKAEGFFNYEDDGLWTRYLHLQQTALLAAVLG